MAAEWLSAAQVAEIGFRGGAIASLSNPHTIQMATYAFMREDLPVLVAQDGRWRALVGALLDALGAAGPREIADAMTARWAGYGADVFASPRTRRAFNAVKAAQAVLDGAPGEG